MMIRKIWRFLWYQNRNNFEKNEKRKDQAPLTHICIAIILAFSYFPWKFGTFNINVNMYILLKIDMVYSTSVLHFSFT